MNKTELAAHLEALSGQKIKPIEWRDGALYLLDQRRLPQEEDYLPLKSAVEVAAAITDMVVRGAPAIGIAAAYGVVLGAAANQNMEKVYQVLGDSRPTAVNLHWALKRMKSVAQDVESLLSEAVSMHLEDLQQNLQMAELAVGCLDGKVNVLTHCNTGSLATAGHGTALGVIRTAHEKGILGEVYAGETRPWLQGARLTAWELAKEGISARLIADSAAASLMQAGRVDWVIVGADRIAANGDVANKIGTYSLAVMARHHGVKFMVVAPTGTVDIHTASGAEIPIEEREEGELFMLGGKRVAAEGVGGWNPVFDVTPASLVDVLVTEKAVLHRPDNKKVESLF